MNLPLRERLLKAASLVGDESDFTAFGVSERCENKVVVADVGCDHAYLSIYLIKEGICDLAIASDLREGPIQAAKENVIRFGCEEKIVTVKTDGLHGLEKYSPTDVVICGMGGETITEILNEAPWIKKQGTRLILQPQSGAAELYLYLSSCGFHLVKERYAYDQGKPYRIFKFIYDGVSRFPSLEEALIGRLYEEEDRNSFLLYLSKIAGTVEKKTISARALNPKNNELDLLLGSIRDTIRSHS